MSREAFERGVTSLNDDAHLLPTRPNTSQSQSQRSSRPLTFEQWLRRKVEGGELPSTTIKGSIAKGALGALTLPAQGVQFGAHKALGAIQGRDTENFREFVRTGQGAGDVIREAGGNLPEGRWEWNIPGTSWKMDPGQWANRATGAIGEVVSDPYSGFVGGQFGSILSGGAKKVVARELADTIATETGERVSVASLRYAAGGTDNAAMQAKRLLNATPEVRATPEWRKRAVDLASPYEDMMQEQAAKVLKTGGTGQDILDTRIFDAFFGGADNKAYAGLRYSPLFWRARGGIQVIPHAEWATAMTGLRKARLAVANSPVGAQTLKARELLGNKQITEHWRTIRRFADKGDAAQAAQAARALQDTRAGWRHWDTVRRESARTTDILHSLLRKNEDLQHAVLRVAETPETAKTPESLASERLISDTLTNMNASGFRKRRIAEQFGDASPDQMVRKVFQDVYDETKRVAPEGSPNSWGDIGQDNYASFMLTLDQLKGRPPGRIAGLGPASRNFPERIFGRSVVTVKEGIRDGYLVRTNQGLRLTDEGRQSFNHAKLRDELDELTKDALGDDWEQLYERNPVAILERYISAADKFMRARIIQNSAEANNIGWTLQQLQLASKADQIGGEVKKLQKSLTSTASELAELINRQATLQAAQDAGQLVGINAQAAVRETEQLYNQHMKTLWDARDQLAKHDDQAVRRLGEELEELLNTNAGTREQTAERLKAIVDQTINDVRPSYNAERTAMAQEQLVKTLQRNAEQISAYDRYLTKAKEDAATTQNIKQQIAKLKNKAAQKRAQAKQRAVAGQSEPAPPTEPVRVELEGQHDIFGGTTEAIDSYEASLRQVAPETTPPADEIIDPMAPGEGQHDIFGGIVEAKQKAVDLSEVPIPETATVDVPDLIDLTRRESQAIIDAGLEQFFGPKRTGGDTLSPGDNLVTWMREAAEDTSVPKKSREILAELAEKVDTPRTTIDEVVEHTDELTEELIAFGLDDGLRFTQKDLATYDLPLWSGKIKMDELVLDPDRFQFKIADTTTGKTGRLDNIKTWDYSKGRTMIVYIENGVPYVADGHQRYNLWREIRAAGGNAPAVQEVQIIRSLDGWTPEQARFYAAEQNIKEQPENLMNQTEVRRQGAERWAQIKDQVGGTQKVVDSATRLSRMSDEAWKAVRLVVQNIRDDTKMNPAWFRDIHILRAEDQAKVVRDQASKWAKNPPSNENVADETIDVIRESIEREGWANAQINLFGEQEGSFPVKEMAEIRARIKSQLASGAQRSKTAANTQEERAAAGSVIDVEGELQAAESLTRARAAFDSWYKYEDGTGQLMQLARDAQDGKITTLKAAKEAVAWFQTTLDDVPSNVDVVDALRGKRLFDEVAPAAAKPVEAPTEPIVNGPITTQADKVGDALVDTQAEIAARQRDELLSRQALSDAEEAEALIKDLESKLNKMVRSSSDEAKQWQKIQDEVPEFGSWHTPVALSIIKREKDMIKQRAAVARLMEESAQKGDTDATAAWSEWLDALDAHENVNPTITGAGDDFRAYAEAGIEEQYRPKGWIAKQVMLWPEDQRETIARAVSELYDADGLELSVKKAAIEDLGTSDDLIKATEQIANTQARVDEIERQLQARVALQIKAASVRENVQAVQALGHYKLREGVAGFALPTELANGIASINKFDEIHPFFRGYERILRVIKGQMISTPRFTQRNFQGALWINQLFGSTPVDWLRYADAYAARQMGRPARNAAMQERFDVIDMVAESNISQSHGLAGEEVHKAVRGSVGLLPTAGLRDQRKQWFYVSAFRWLNEHVENTVRGALAMSVVQRSPKGMSRDAQITMIEDVVNKAHFNYSDLSKFDRGARMLFPFWVWMSRNPLLQLELLARRPAMALNAQKLYDNVEESTPANPFAPSYFEASLYKKVSKDRYLMFETPFDSFAADLWIDTSNTGFMAALPRIAHNVSPVIKLPVELASKRDLYRDYPLYGWDYGHRTIETLLPIWAQTRRLVWPRTETGKANQRNAIISWATGAFRDTTERDKINTLTWDLPKQYSAYKQTFGQTDREKALKERRQEIAREQRRRQIEQLDRLAQ